MKADLEPLLSSPDSTLLSKLIRLPSFDHPYHFHPEVEITFIAKSSGTRLLGGHIGSFQAGELYLLGENLPHVFRNTLRPKRGAEAEVLHFSRSPQMAFLEAMPEMRGFKSLLDRSRAGLVFDPETSRQGARLLRRIRQTSGALRLAAFCELAGVLAQASKPCVLATAGAPLSPRQTVGSRRIQRICNFVLEKFTDDLTHRGMAKLAHMAPASFSRLFLRTTRTTFTHFVTEVRLSHACRLLRESDRTIADIAFASGFNNLSNFNRQFRRTYGLPPTDYRRSAAGG
jgi:AraC-like DNA-binding protein